MIWFFPPCRWVLPRYNKTLLGDKLGKFPAPLLMNTVHFALQAALSKIIVLFQAKGLDGAVEMSWKDYFMRGVHLLGLSISPFIAQIMVVHASVLSLPSCSRPNCSGDRAGQIGRAHV